jgi:hypothetical protein
MEQSQAKQITSLSGSVSVSFQYKRPAGPRSNEAGLRLTCTTSEHFFFRSNALWEIDNYNEAVEKGVIEVIAEVKHLNPKLGFVLEEIEIHDVNSSWMTFYRASGAATKAIIELLVSEYQIQPAKS